MWKRALMLMALVGALCCFYILPAIAGAGYEISGNIWDENDRPLSGVKLIFSDGVTINSGTSFSRTVSGGGTMTVKPEKTGYRFKYHFLTDGSNDNWVWIPAGGVNVGPAGPSGVVMIEFCGHREETPKYNISGRVTTQDGVGIPGVIIYFSEGITVPYNAVQGGGSITPAITDDSGCWGKNDLSGSVTVIASKAGWNFIPPYILVGSPSSMVNFVGTPKSTVSVNLNGSRLYFDQNPEIRNDRVLVPLRKILESLGAKIEWDAKTQTITAIKGETTLKLTIGSVDAYVNGVLVKLDQPPIVVNGRTLLPLRFISEALEARVAWDEDKKTVQIISRERNTSVQQAGDTLIQGIKQNDPTKQISLLTQALQEDPQFTLAYYLRAETYIELKQLDNAIKDFTDAIKLNPNYTDAYSERGTVYVMQEKYDQALADFEKIIQLDPNYYSAYVGRGVAYYNLKNIDKGLANLDKAVEMDPNNPMAYSWRGKIYAMQGQKDKAIANYKKALELDPDNQNWKRSLNILGAPGY